MTGFSDGQFLQVTKRRKNQKRKLGGEGGASKRRNRRLRLPGSHGKETFPRRGDDQLCQCC